MLRGRHPWHFRPHRSLPSLSRPGPAAICEWRLRGSGPRPRGRAPRTCERPPRRYAHAGLAGRSVCLPRGPNGKTSTAGNGLGFSASANSRRKLDHREARCAASQLRILVIRAQISRHKPAIAQLVEHLTGEICSDQMVPGSIPGGRTCCAWCSPMQIQCFARAVILALGTCSNTSMPEHNRSSATPPAALPAFGLAIREEGDRDRVHFLAQLHHFRLRTRRRRRRRRASAARS
jgi:hypothetical protein